VIGGSSDHIILELAGDLKVGDVLAFRVNYPGLLQLMSSKYVHHVYL